MKYKTVRVSPSGDGWVVSFVEDGVERVVPLIATKKEFITDIPVGMNGRKSANKP